MKRIIFIMLLIAALTLPVLGQGATSWNIYQRPTSDWFSAGSARDIGWQWAMSIDALVAAGEQVGTGSTFYVDSGVTNAGDGSNLTNAVATLQEAIDLCEANRGDRIYVAQGHAETVASAAAIDCDCAGITIIAIGSGEDQPEFSLSTNLSTFQVSAADVTLFNLRFLSTKTAGGVAQGIDVTADGDGFRMFFCRMLETSVDTEFTKALNLTADADECVIAYNRFLFFADGTGSDAVAITLEGGSDQTVIQGNYFNGDWSGYVIDGTAAQSLNLLVKDNIIHNYDTTAGGTMAFEATTTGDIVGNKCYGNHASTHAIVGNAMFISPDNVAMGTENVETRNYASMLGDYTGDLGTDAGDSVLQDFVLAQTDLDALITSVAAIGGFYGVATTTVDTTHTTDSAFTGFHDEQFTTNYVLIVTHDAGGAQGAPEGEIVDITDYTASTGAFTHAALTAATATGDRFLIARKEEMLVGDSITAASIADDAISSEHLNTGAFTADAFAADALVAGTFATGAFTADAFAADALVAGTFNTGAFTADAFAADALIAATFATGALTADAYAADALVAATFATDSISDDAIADNAIDAGAIAANAITSSKIATGAIDADAIATAAITNAEIETDAIGAAEIAADAITSSEIAADAIGSSELAATAVAEIAAGVLEAETSGSVFYVNSAGDNSDGLSWATALTTLSGGVGLTTASANDIIYVGAGHAENITAAGGLTMNKTGVQVIGCGVGALAPTYTFTTSTGADIEIDNPCSFTNIAFDMASLDAMLAPIDVDAADVEFHSCTFTVADGAAQAVTTIELDAGADRFLLDDCVFVGGANDGPGSVVTMVATAPESVRIIDCWFEADCDNAVIYGTGTPSNVIIQDSHISNLDSGVAAIVFTSTATGVIKDCTISTDAYATAIDPGTCELYNVLWYDSDAPADNVAIPILAANASAGAQIGTIDLAAIQAEVTSAIEADLLEKFASAATADTTDPVDIVVTEVADNSVLAQIMTQDGDASGFERLTDSLEALSIGLEMIKGSSGDIYYVDDSGTDSTYATTGYGRGWSKPFDTIDYAISQCTANNGDIILVKAGHTTTLGATAESYAENGITVIGMGTGLDMATIVFDDAGSTIDVTGDGITLINLRFSSTSAATTMTLDVDADRFSLIGCEFTETGDFEHAISVDLGATCENALIKDCTFNGAGTGASSAIAITGGVIDNCRIIGNTIWGDFTDAAVHSTQVNTNMLFKDNVITNRNSGNHAIQLNATTTGTAIDNRFRTDAFSTGITVADLMWIGNLFVDATDEGGYPIPAVGDSTDNYIGTASADNDAVTTAILANGDGSVLERLEFLQTKSDAVLAKLGASGVGIGDVYYVDSVTGSSGDNGTTWALAEALIVQGETDCSANVGDIVFVAPGHAEVLGDAVIAMDTAGVTLIGLGDGTDMPFIDMQHGNSSVVMTAANVTIKGINFHSSTAITDTSVDLGAGASDFTLEDCLFTDAGDFEHVISVNIGADGENCTIRNCRFESLTGHTGATSAIAFDAGVIDRLIIEDCHIWGDFDNGGIYNATHASTNALIRNNSITNNESGDHAIELAGAVTGDLINNMLSGNTYGQILDPGSMRCFGNKQTVGIDAGAEDVPLIAGKSYSRSMLVGDLNAVQNLFDVDGGPILITFFVGHCTVDADAATTREIELDSDDAGKDYDFSTAVDIQAVNQGDYIIFDATAGESVLSVAAMTASGSMGPNVNWMCEEGLIICQNTAADGGAGNIEWYMTFIPLVSGVEVVPQAGN